MKDLILPVPEAVSATYIVPVPVPHEHGRSQAAGQ